MLKEEFETTPDELQNLREELEKWEGEELDEPLNPIATVALAILLLLGATLLGFVLWPIINFLWQFVVNL